jgi:hypothetical protein
MALSLTHLLAVSSLLSAAENAAEVRGLPQSNRAALERAIEGVRSAFWAEVDGGMSRVRNFTNTITPTARGFK